MEILEHTQTLSRVQSDIAAGIVRIVAQVERLNAVISEGGFDCHERIALWDLESNQARLNSLQSATLNRIAHAAAATVVLVVEDEPLTLMSATDCLTSSGFAVLEASNADEAMEQLVANPAIGAIFTDVQMRGSMNGLELAREVHRRWPTIKVVVTSGNHTFGSDDLSPGDRFVRKPYSADDIVSALRAH
ncbi:MAG: response regulator [Devosia sp.]